MARPRPSTWLKALVFLALAFIILRNVDLGRVGADLERVPPGAYALAFAALVASVALQALRWKVLLKDPAIPYRECYAFIGVGSSLAMVSPSSLLADGAVGYWLGKRQQGVLRALSALLAARILGVAAGVILLVIAAPSHLWVFGELAVALAISLGVQLIQIAAHWIAYRAIGAPIAFTDLLFFLPLIALLGMAPISLGGMGVREGLGIFFFTMLPGVGKEAVLAEAGFRYLLMAVMAAMNIAIAGAILGGGGCIRERVKETAT